MTKTLGEQKEAAEQRAEISGEEITSATDVLLSVVKTAKASKMYLANNPILHRFFEELKTRLGNHLDEYGDLRLDIEQFELQYKGKGVYENHEPQESLAFRMYADGIRSLLFTEGIEEREIREFLEIMGMKSGSDEDDDMVTLLWIKELPHIVCILADDYLELDTDVGLGSAYTVPQRDAIQGLYRAMPTAPEPVASHGLLPQHIISLTETETTGLQKAKVIDERRGALDEVMEVLLAILSVEKDIVVFGDFADIMVNLIGNLIHSGDIHDALALVTLVRRLSKSETLSPDHHDRLAKAMEGAIAADIIKDLESTLDSTDTITEENLRDILLLLGKSNIKPICELLGILQKVEMRMVVIDVLAVLGKDSPEVFYPYVTDERWQLVRDSLIILRRIGSPASLGPVSTLVTHKEPKIRREVLLSLDAFPGREAKMHILQFLQDETSALRILAVKILAAAKYQEALKPIREMVLSKTFDAKDLAEKKALFESLGELGADEVVPLFQEVLFRKYWFNKAKEMESVTLAVLGLGKVKTEAALKVLEEGMSKKTDEIKLIIARGRRGIGPKQAGQGAA